MSQELNEIRGFFCKGTLFVALVSRTSLLDITLGAFFKTRLKRALVVNDLKFCPSIH